MLLLPTGWLEWKIIWIINFLVGRTLVGGLTCLTLFANDLLNGLVRYPFVFIDCFDLDLKLVPNW
jgi:hypothetical protein